MSKINLFEDLKNNSYPGRGIVIGTSPDGKSAVTAYFIMGRSENSRNRVFAEDGDGIRTQAFDESKLENRAPYHICAGSCSRKQDDCYKRRPDRHDI